MPYDVFISHASENKADVALPLANLLKKQGIRVWLDSFELKLGDSLRRSIDRGLSESRFGIVILSPEFLRKDWPRRELDGLVSREVGARKVILPIWHNITRDEVLQYSPPLADKLSVSTKQGLEYVAQQVLQAIKDAPHDHKSVINFEEAPVVRSGSRKLSWKLITATIVLLGLALVLMLIANYQKDEGKSLLTNQLVNSAAPAKRFIILVADFDSLDGNNYGITENLVFKLREVTHGFPDIEIQTLNETIKAKPGSDEARSKGKEHNAALVLWGWNLNYHVTACFEILKKPKLLNLRRAFESISGLTMHESFDLQARVSSDMNHLVLLTIGLARLEQRDYDGAISLLSRAIIHKAPDEIVAPWSAYFYRGAAYYYRYKYDQALSDFDQVIALNPLKVDGYINRALVLRLKGDSTKSAADTKKAIALLNQSIKQNTDNYDVYVLRGIVYANALNYSNAISEFSKAIEIYANDSETLDYRARIYQETRDYDRAISDWTIILELDPTNVSAYVSRGMTFGMKGDLDRAFADFNSALSRHAEQQELAEAFVGRGNVYGLQHQNDRALADFNEALRLKPDLAEAFVGRCIVYSERNELDHAIAECSAALALKPTLFEAVFNRGGIYLQKRDLAHAIDDYRQAVRLNPHDANSYNKLAAAYGVVQQYDNAIQTATAAIEREPDLAEAFCTRGAAYYHKRQFDLAINDFDEAIRLKPDFALAHSNKAHAVKAKSSK